MNMLRGVQDAMSQAIEGADVMLYGVSKAYKESSNCRLEANVSTAIYRRIGVQFV